MNKSKKPIGPPNINLEDTKNMQNMSVPTFFWLMFCAFCLGMAFIGVIEELGIR